VPGQVDSTTFEGIYTLTAQDLINGIVTNQAQVVGTTPSGQVAQDLSDNQNNINDNPTVINISGCVIEVFNFISSNGSPGSNDIFKIAGIDCYPDNTVEIYNRWGVLVFETKGYDNTSRVFNGISNGRVTINQNSRLPDGTYFYVLRYKNFTGGNIEKAGYLYIKN
jgi:gliding motility-associated-like protein